MRLKGFKGKRKGHCSLEKILPTQKKFNSFNTNIPITTMKCMYELRMGNKPVLPVNCNIFFDNNDQYHPIFVTNNNWKEQ